MALEASQPLKISLPVSAALAQALYNEWVAATVTTNANFGNAFYNTPLAQYTFVKVNASGQADVIAATSDIPIGVIQNAPFVPAQAGNQVGGKTGEIVIIGITKLALGGTVTLGGATGLIEFTSAGLAVAAGAATGGSKTIVGQFLSAGASGDHVKAVVNCVFTLPTGN